MGADLDQAGGFRQVDRRVSDFREEDRVDDGVVLKVLQDSHAFDLCCATMDVELA